MDVGSKPPRMLAALSDFEQRFQEAVPLVMQALAVMAGGSEPLAMITASYS